MDAGGIRVERDGDRVRLITRGGYDWTKPYLWIAEAALKNRIKHFVVDGEAVVLGVDGISDFNALHVEGRITPAALSRPLLHQYPLSPMPFAGLRQACRFVFVAERTHLAVGK